MIRFLDAFAQRHEDLTRDVLTRLKTLGARRLIVFLTPGYELRVGGILSIAAIYRESRALHHLHGARVALCCVPGDPQLLKYTWFENRNYIFGFGVCVTGLQASGLFAVAHSRIRC